MTYRLRLVVAFFNWLPPMAWIIAGIALIVLGVSELLYIETQRSPSGGTSNSSHAVANCYHDAGAT